MVSHLACSKVLTSVDFTSSIDRHLIVFNGELRDILWLITQLPQLEMLGGCPSRVARRMEWAHRPKVPDEDVLARVIEITAKLVQLDPQLLP